MLKVGTYGKVTLPSLLGLQHWIVIAAVVIIGVAAVGWIDRKGV